MWLQRPLLSYGGFYLSRGCVHNSPLSRYSPDLHCDCGVDYTSDIFGLTNNINKGVTDFDGINMFDFFFLRTFIYDQELSFRIIELKGRTILKLGGARVNFFQTNNFFSCVVCTNNFFFMYCLYKLFFSLILERKHFFQTSVRSGHF